MRDKNYIDLSESMANGLKEEEVRLIKAIQKYNETMDMARETLGDNFVKPLLPDSVESLVTSRFNPGNRNELRSLTRLYDGAKITDFQRVSGMDYDISNQDLRTAKTVNRRYNAMEKEKISIVKDKLESLNNELKNASSAEDIKDIKSDIQKQKERLNKIKAMSHYDPLKSESRSSFASRLGGRLGEATVGGIRQRNQQFKDNYLKSLRQAGYLNDAGGTAAYNAIAKMSVEDFVRFATDNPDIDISYHYNEAASDGAISQLDAALNRFTIGSDQY